MSISTTLDPSYGFHTSLTTKLAGFSPSSKDCTLHVLYTLPPLAFVDPYELDLHEKTFTYRYSGVRNLELPIMALDRDRQATLLVNVPLHNPDKAPVDLEVKIPLHFRYGTPQDDGGTGIETVSMPQPFGYTSCPTRESTDQPPWFSSLPFGSLSPPPLKGSILTQLVSAPGVLEQRIPVGQRGDLSTVEIGTAVVFLLCFFYLTNVTTRTVKRMGLASTTSSAKKTS